MKKYIIDTTGLGEVEHRQLVRGCEILHYRDKNSLLWLFLRAQTNLQYRGEVMRVMV